MMTQSTSRLLAVFFALLVLLAATVATARIDLGFWNFPIAAGIASVKMALIAVWFMELRESKSLTRLVAGIGILWLMILMWLTLADYWTRNA